MMPKKAHTEEQIVAVLQQGQLGERCAERTCQSN